MLAQATSALDEGSVVDMWDLVRRRMRAPQLLQPEHTLRRLPLPSKACF